MSDTTEPAPYSLVRGPDGETYFREDAEMEPWRAEGYDDDGRRDFYMDWAAVLRSTGGQWELITRDNL